MDTPLTPEQLEAIRKETLAGHKIQAIKLYREATGKALAESKRDVETFEVEWRAAAPASTPVPGSNEAPTPAQLEEIRNEALAGNKIQAIKLYREATGLGLAESKQAVEDLTAQWRAGSTASTPAPPKASSKKTDTPFARPAKTGCFNLALLGGAGLWGVAHWLFSR